MVVLSWACGAFAGASGACDDAVGVGEVSPAVLAYHYPAECFVAGAEGAGVCSCFAAEGACSHVFLLRWVMGWMVIKVSPGCGVIQTWKNIYEI